MIIPTRATGGCHPASRHLMASPSASARIAMLGVVLLLAACSSAFLELNVSNESTDAAELQLVSGIEGDPAREPIVHYTEVVNAGARRTLAVERPGPNEWTLYVSGVPHLHVVPGIQKTRRPASRT